ncbi:hypothetical protein WA538_005547 [Blastocystis sp. DL]
MPVLKRMLTAIPPSAKPHSYTLPGTLHLVSTPIGCVDDLSKRALSVLKGVSLILAEDTRTTGLMLNRVGVSNKLESLNQENERSKVPAVLSYLKEGKSVALVSDAGTPVVSDPGSILVKSCIDHAIPVTPIPGPSAAIAALVCSGFYTTPFQFVGFIKRSGSERKTQLESIAASPNTVILYESSHRIVDTIRELAAVLGGSRRICICREMTKLHETIRYMDLSEAAEFITTGVQKGEFTLVLEGLREFNERMEVPSESSAVSEGVLRCIREMKKEGIDREVIMRVMEASFHLKRSEVKKELYR